MKKLLSILGAVSLTTVGGSNIISNKTIEFQNFSEIKKTLKVTPIRQETEYYCAAASVQMILNYFNNNIHEYSQEELHRLIGGVPGQGAHIDHTISMVIEYRIDNHEEPGIEYYYNHLNAGYGSNINELRMFQEYVVASLNNNCPLFFGYVPSPKNGHAVVINGIEVNEDPSLTAYHYIDPWNGQNSTFMGNAIPFYCTLGGELVVGTDNVDFKNKTIKISVDSQEKKEYTSDGGTYNVPVNFTQQLGIINYDQFQDEINTIEFADWSWKNHWYGHHSEYHDYNFNAENIPNDNDSWRYRNNYSSHWNEQLWYSPVINNENIFLWDSTKTAYDENNNDFNITFQFKITISFLSPSLITMANPDMPKEHLDFTTGNTIILKLK